MDACKLQRYFIYISISVLALPLFAQDQFLSKEVNVKAGFFRLDSLLNNITQQTGIVFSYNAKRFDSKRRMSVPHTIKTFGGFLDVLKKEKGFAIKMIENYVVITAAAKEPPQKNIPLPLALISKLQELKKSEISSRPTNVIPKEDSVAAVKSDSTLKQVEKTVTVPEQKATIISTNASAQETKPVPQPEQKTAMLSTPNSVVQKKPPVVPSDSVNKKKSQSSPKNSTDSWKKNLFVKPGVTFDESSFMGIIFQGGLPIVYATLSVNSNLLAAQVRYGIGSSYKVSSSMRIHFVASNGDVSRSGTFADSAGTRHPIAVKSNLLRVGLGVELRLKSKFSLQVIPSFNQLNTSYSINHTSSDLSLFGDKGDNLFYAIKPPYVISNTFSPSSNSNVKTWIGLQLNLVYHINFN